MNIKKTNIPVLVAREAYVGQYNHHDLFAVYLERNAFWKILNVLEDDTVIYTTDSVWVPKVVSGKEYHQMTIQHNNQLLAERSPLDKGERRYLKGVINPIRDKVKYIVKLADGVMNEYIHVSFILDGYLSFPDFEIGKMYKGMELGKHYTPDELGL